MAIELEVLRAAQRAPLRTVRARDVASLTVHPARVLAALAEDGMLTKVTHGVYVAPPDGRDGRRWIPEIEAGGLAVATVRFGDRVPILMGIGAARHWGAYPRALGATVVAVPQGEIRKPVSIAGGGVVHLIARRLDTLDAILQQTELGPALVTARVQTAYDLLMRPRQGGVPDVALEAAEALLPQLDAAEFASLVDQRGRANDRVRAVLDNMDAADADG